MSLVDAGVPWETAWAMEDFERFALLIIIGERNGGKFDWETMTWAPEDP
ncbi:MAG TPA: hypothetical protein VIE66_02575 [Methylocella sp.]|jgi:hypothetical protein